MQDANSPVSKFSVFYAIDAPQPPLYDFFAIQGGNTSLNGKINQSIKFPTKMLSKTMQWFVLFCIY